MDLGGKLAHAENTFAAATTVRNICMGKESNRHFLDALLSNVEVIIDNITDNELVRSIPVIGTAFKIVKGLDDVRSKALQSKLQGFLASPGMDSDAATEAFKKKLEASPEEAEKAGETLFLVLERLIDLRKPPLLAKVFLSFLNENVSLSSLQRLATAIDLAFMDDIDSMVTPNPPAEVLRNLLNSGLAEINYTALYGGFNSLDFRLSKIGKMLREIIIHSQNGPAA